MFKITKIVVSKQNFVFDSNCKVFGQNLAFRLREPIGRFHTPEK